MNISGCFHVLLLFSYETGRTEVCDLTPLIVLYAHVSRRDKMATQFKTIRGEFCFVVVATRPVATRPVLIVLMCLFFFNLI